MHKNSNHDEVYEKLSSMLGIKFKAQLRESPIEFDKIIFCRNLINDNETFSVIIKKDKKHIVFKEKKDFIHTFLNYIQTEIDRYEKRYKDLIDPNQNNNGLKSDDHQLYIEHEEIGHGTDKLEKLKERLIKILKKNINLANSNKTKNQNR